MVSKLTQYNRATNCKSRVIEIELVLSTEDNYNIEEIMEGLRQYGTAVVIDEFFVIDSYGEAAQIARNRAKRGSY